MHGNVYTRASHQRSKSDHHYHSNTMLFSKAPFIDPFSGFHSSYDTTYLSWREFLVLFTQAPDRDIAVCVQSGRSAVPGYPARESLLPYRLARLIPDPPRTGAFARAPFSRSRRPSKMNKMEQYSTCLPHPRNVSMAFYEYM